jgi:nucleotide-binding universal stress UspA family protein
MPVVEGKSRVAVKNILFPTDFSERSAAALPYAAAIARHYRAKVYVAHVVMREPAVVPAAGPPVSNWKIAEQEMAILDRCDLLNGIPYETLVEEGEIWDVLSEMIRQREIDLIVLGTHGLGGFRKLISGSVAEDIIREAPCPVLAVGPEVPSRAQLLGDMRHILCATDFGPGSLTALEYAVSIAEENRAQLTVVHAVDAYNPLLVPENRDDAFQQLLPADTALVLPPEFVVKIGSAAEVILELARDRHSDLIVMGAHEAPFGPLSTRLAWPTLHRVLCEARSPVLTVRE